jgi:Gametolysin peptidase M11/MG2 domain/NPCBM-associated, NEW3 domain of alpha-galactosidase
MNLRTCFPRPVRLAVFASLVLLSSTFVFAHNPAASDTDPVAVTQWRAGAPQIQLQGQIEIIHQDFPDGHGKYVYTLKQSDGTRVPMHFVKNPPTHLLTGDKVTANGQQSSSGLILYSGGNVKNSGGGGSTSGGTSGSSIPVPNTFGTQQVLIMLVNFQDDVIQPYTAAAVQNAFFATSNSFFAENSYQQTSLTGAVVGWYTIPDSVTTCNISQIATDTKNAATAAGVNLANYTRYVYFFPYNSNCVFAGASNVGGNPSESWINGTLDIRVLNHELGHAFGLWHSHFLDCGTTATICSSGNTIEYGDLADTMGYVQTPSPQFNAYQKERLGWLNYGASPSIQTVTSSGTYTINPYELGGTGPNALKVLKSTDPATGAKTWYYLESRQSIGFDSFLTDGTCPQCYTQNATTGVLFHLGTDGDGNSSELIDMTPATSTEGYYWDMALVTGQSFQDSTAGVTFTPTAVSGSGATVQIAISGSSCTPANPSVTVLPLQSFGVTSGTALSFTTTVADNDGSGCSAATFNLGNALPAGWTGVWSTPAISLSPGKSGSATLTVTSPVGTADGSYNVTVNASNSSATSFNGSAVATYAIATPAALSVSMWTDQSSYLPGQTVTIRVGLLDGTVPDVGAGVSVTVTSPKGRTATLSGTTGSNGVASLSYKLSKNAPAGTYQAQYGGATLAGAASTAGASTSFTVQ